MSLFLDDESDSESVDTNSTVESADSQKEYAVEKILYEKHNRDGKPTYLIKWEGYPLHKSTFEPAENLWAGLLQEWELMKRRVAAGLEPGLDENEFYAAIDAADIAKDRRKTRRKAKRKKRANLTSPAAVRPPKHAIDRKQSPDTVQPGRLRIQNETIGLGHEEDPSVKETPSATKQRAQDDKPSTVKRASPQKRKGVARLAKKPVAAETVLIEDDSDSVFSPPSEADSMMEELAVDIEHRISSEFVALRPRTRSQAQQSPVKSSPSQGMVLRLSTRRSKRPDESPSEMVQAPTVTKHAAMKEAEQAMPKPAGREVVVDAVSSKAIQVSGSPSKQALHPPTNSTTSAKETNQSAPDNKLVRSEETPQSTPKPPKLPEAGSEQHKMSTSSPSKKMQPPPTPKSVSVNETQQGPSKSTPHRNEHHDAGPVKPRPTPTSPSKALQPQTNIGHVEKLQQSTPATCPKRFEGVDFGFVDIKVPSSSPSKTNGSFNGRPERSPVNSKQAQGKPGISVPNASNQLSPNRNEDDLKTIINRSSEVLPHSPTKSTVAARGMSESPGISTLEQPPPSETNGSQSATKSANVEPEAAAASMPATVPATQQASQVVVEGSPAVQPPHPTKRKSAPSIFANWTLSNSKRTRARASHETVQSEPGRLFGNMSTQHNYQKHKATEAPPNPDQLTFVNPATGQTQPPKAPRMSIPPSAIEREHLTHPNTVSGEIHQAYRPRSPPQPRDRSLSRVETATAKVAAHADGVQQAFTATADNDTDTSRLTKKTACLWWQRGICRYTAEECWFAHTSSPSQPFTCWYWKHDEHGCKLPAERCRFAHYDTGCYTQPPRGCLPKDREHANPLRKQSGGRESRRQSSYHNAQRREDAQDSTSLQNSGAVDIHKTMNLDDKHFDTIHFPVDIGSLRVSASGDGRDNFLGSTQSPNLKRDSPILSKLFTAIVPTSKLVFEGDQGRSIQIDTHLVYLTSKESIWAKSSLGIDQHLNIERFSNAVQFNEEYDDVLSEASSWPMGEIAADIAGSSAMCYLYDKLKTGTKVAHGICGRAMLIIVPANATGYRAIGLHPLPTDSDSSLLFRLVPHTRSTRVPKHTLQQPTIADLEEPCKDQSISSAELLSLDTSRILTIKGKPKAISVFVMTQENCQSWLAILVHFFRSLGCHVQSSKHPYAWDNFERHQRSNAVLIVHPSVRLWQIPNIRNFLRLGNYARVFAVGKDEHAAALDNRQPRFTAWQLFPYSEAILITDDIFLETPDTAATMLNTLRDAERIKAVGATNSRIVTRPGIKEWLKHLAIEKSVGRGRKDTRWINLYGAICKICPEDDEDPYDRPNPLPKALLVSLPTAELETYATKSVEDSRRGTDYLVNWFAGWGVANATNYRRFIVCHNHKGQGDNDDGERWAKEYQHVTVMTPSEWLEMRAAKR